MGITSSGNEYQRSVLFGLAVVLADKKVMGSEIKKTAAQGGF